MKLPTSHNLPNLQRSGVGLLSIVAASQGAHALATEHEDATDLLKLCETNGVQNADVIATAGGSFRSNALNWGDEPHLDACVKMLRQLRP